MHARLYHLLPMMIACLLLTGGCARGRAQRPADRVDAEADAALTPAGSPHAPGADGIRTASGLPAVPALPMVVDLGHLTRQDCLRLALASNRTFLMRHSQMERARLGETVARCEVYAPQLTASYLLSNGPDAATACLTPSPTSPTTGMIGISEPLLGFNIQPFFNAGWNQAGDTLSGRDAYSSSYGLTVSHMLLNIAERIRQQLPITTAETNFFIAANNVVLEGKSVELETTRAFYNVERALGHVRVRERRRRWRSRGFLTRVQEDACARPPRAPLEALAAQLVVNQGGVRPGERAPGARSRTPGSAWRASSPCRWPPP